MRLSFRNNILIQGQRPGAAHVATFNAWKGLGRSVKKGEKALSILMPRLKAVPQKNDGSGSLREKTHPASDWWGSS
jgi:hypothetical protein